MSMVSKPMSISALAVLTGRDRRTIAARLAYVQPTAKSGKSDLYPTPAALAAIYMGGDDGSDALDHTHESARLKHAQADEKELQVLEQRGELIPAGLVEMRWSDMAMAMRAKMLALPTTVAQQVAMRPAKEIESIAKSLVNQALAELSNERRMSGPGSSGSDRSEDLRPDEAATGSDNQPMG